MAQNGPPDKYPMPVVNKIQTRATSFPMTTLNVPNVGHPGVQTETVNRLGKWDKNPYVSQGAAVAYNLQARQLQQDHENVMKQVMNTPLHRLSAVPLAGTNVGTNVFALKPGILPKK